MRRSAVGRWCLTVVMACTSLVLLDAAPAQAHGEGTQQSWVRTTTATFFDVEFSGDARDLGGDRGYEVNVGEVLKVTGKMQLSDKWPAVLGGFGLGSIGALVPGPVLAIQDIRVNGAFTPGSVVMKPGDFFNFELKLIGRRPGHYHLHPRVDLKGKGPIVGAGTWVTVRATGKPYEHKVTLASGKQVNVERYGADLVYGYQLLWMAIALLFVVVWFRKKRLLSRLAALRRGEDDSLMISSRDKKFTAAIGLLTIITIAAGYIYATNKWDTIPLQVRREAVPAVQPTPLADAVLREARYSADRERLRMVVDVKSLPGTPRVRIERLMLGPVSVAAKPFYSARRDELLTSRPDGYVEAGGTQTFTFDISAHKLNEERLLFTNSAIAQIGGLLIVRSDDGRRGWVSIIGDLIKE